MENNAMDRRQFLTTTAGIALGGFAASAPAIAQAKTKLRIGYLHTVAVDGQIWTGMDRGTFDKQGLDLELRQFNTGLEIFQALIGGSLDVLATGAVLSNFPARGQGKVFLINDIEVATAQLWIRSDQGIKSFEDLKGKRIATATGTTAHVFLDKALRANKIDPKEVELVNQTMPAAVTAFISGAVPAVALWVPFNVTVRDRFPAPSSLPTHRPIIRRPPSSAAGRPPTTIMSRTRRPSPSSSRAGRKRTTISSPTAVKRWRLCRRPTTARPRWRTSTSHSRRKRCSPRTSGNGSIQTARSPIGCSNRPTSSWRMPGSRTSRPRASISIRASISRPLPDRCNRRQTAVGACRLRDACSCTAHAGHFRSRQRPNGHCRLPSPSDQSRNSRNN